MDLSWVCYHLAMTRTPSLSLFFNVMAVPMEYGSSWARDGIQPAAVTYTTGAVTPDPLTHCARLGIKLTPLQ